MKRNWLKGHKRQIVKHSRRNYTTACRCGWSGGAITSARTAQILYSGHIASLLSGNFKCIDCGAEKPIEFMKIDFRYLCKECSVKRSNLWQKNHPRETSRQKRDFHLKKHFGIGLVEFEAIMVEQGGVCAICGCDIKDRRGYAAHLDHDHETGMVRGVLCLKCNVGLGAFQDNPRLLKTALQYLEKHSSPTK